MTPGKVRIENRARLEQEQQAEEKRLAIMMMKKKEKHLYDKIMFGKKRKIREVCSTRLSIKCGFIDKTVGAGNIPTFFNIGSFMFRGNLISG